MTTEPSRRKRGRRPLPSLEDKEAVPTATVPTATVPTATVPTATTEKAPIKHTILGLAPPPVPTVVTQPAVVVPSGAPTAVSQPQEAAVAGRRSRRPPLSQPPAALEPTAVDTRAPSAARRSRRARGNLGSTPPEASTEAHANPSLAGSPTMAAPGDDFRQPPLPPLVPPPRSPWRRWVQWCLAAAILAAVVGGLTLFLVVRHYSADLPSVEALKAGYNPPQITRILARDDTLLATEFTERRTVVPFEQIPTFAKNAFLAAEDATFYEHEGINYFGLARALFANLKAGRTVQGGSTITQQVVKNVLLDSSRSVRRKVREFLLALRLERSLTKDEIFWLYLNHIYLGHGRYGIEEAARYYFGKHARELGLDEATLLAGVIASPERFSPRRNTDKALARRRFVISQMLQKGFVTQEVHDQVLTMPLRLAPTTETESKLAPEVVHSAKRVLDATLGERKNQGGYTIKTTIDPELQAAARKAVRRNLDRYMERHKLVPPYKTKEIKAWGPAFQGKPRRHKIYVGVVESSDDLSGTIDVRVGDVVGQVALSTEARYNPTGLPPSEFALPGSVLRVSLLEDAQEGVKPPLRLELGPQSALVAIDVRTRDVLALVGSYEALAGGLDRATQTRRQPGSAFKPVVYSYAIHSRRFTPATVIEVNERKHGVSSDGTPRIDVRAAVAHSNNEAATIVLQQSGPAQVVQWARALGIQSPLKADLSLALGSYEVTPFELLQTYVAFARGGGVGEPRFVAEIRTADGQPLALPALPAERQVLTAEEAYLTTSLLRSVIESGTGRAAGRANRELAGKTGTTNDAKDAWFVGYSTEIACAIWVGYDDALPLGPREGGAVTALPAWIDFMERAHVRRPNTRFVQPPSILTVSVDPDTGLLAGPGQLDARMEEFLPGTEPTQLAPVPEEASPSELGDSAPLPPDEAPPPF